MKLGIRCVTSNYARRSCGGRSLLTTLLIVWGVAMTLAGSPCAFSQATVSAQTIVVDAARKNAGELYANSLQFGNPPNRVGTIAIYTGIASQQQPYDAPNAGGLSFFTFSTVRMTIDAHGMVTIPGDASVRTLKIVGGADLAEPFSLSSTAAPQGSIVVIDSDHPGVLKVSDRTYDTRVAGVISGAGGINPGISMRPIDGVGDRGPDVALSGRVFALANTQGGPIKPGDLLTTSGELGHCMRVTDTRKARGAILGKAMTGLDHGEGLVLLLVSLQ
jgi:hypothetical protein